MKEELLRLADAIEDGANDLLFRADGLWGWRRRDKAISIAIGDTSRVFRRIAAALRASVKEQNNGG